MKKVNELFDLILNACRSNPPDANEIAQLRDLMLQLRDTVIAPIPMLIICPSCYQRHIDEGEFATRPHRVHACQSCGLLFQPALVPTVGVRFLPDCKNNQ